MILSSLQFFFGTVLALLAIQSISAKTWLSLALAGFTWWLVEPAFGGNAAIATAAVVVVLFRIQAARHERAEEEKAIRDL